MLNAMIGNTSTQATGSLTKQRSVYPMDVKAAQGFCIHVRWGNASCLAWAVRDRCAPGCATGTRRRRRRWALWTFLAVRAASVCEEESLVYRSPSLPSIARASSTHSTLLSVLRNTIPTSKSHLYLSKPSSHVMRSSTSRSHPHNQSPLSITICTTTIPGSLLTSEKTCLDKRSTF